MIARIVVFGLAAIYFAVVGLYWVALLALACLIPGMLGLATSIFFVVMMFVHGYWPIGIITGATVAFVFWATNSKRYLRSARSAEEPSENQADEPGAVERDT